MKTHLTTLSVIMILSIVFYNSSKKLKKESKKYSMFECGFSSYFYSRFSFSIHYYIVGLIFLFLDLELCMMMPMMTEMDQSFKMKMILVIFIVSLLSALMLEWKEKKLEWKF